MDNLTYVFLSMLSQKRAYIRCTVPYGPIPWYCKIRAQLEYPPTKIHDDLQNVYWNDALKYATICMWIRRFNDGR